MPTTVHSNLSRRAVLRAAGLAGGAALLAACNPVRATPPAAAPMPAPASSAGGEQIVNFLWGYPNNTKQQLFQDFTAATGIQVDVTSYSYELLPAKVAELVGAGGPIDVVELDTIWTARFATDGLVQDISPRMTGALTQDIPDSALSAVRYGDKYYGMPWFNSAKHLFYNARLLDAAGFAAPPPTLDEFVTQAQAATQPGQWGSTWNWDQSEDLLCDWLATMFAQQGAQLLDADGRAVFNTMGGADALQWMIDLLYTHKVADPASLYQSDPTVYYALTTGNYALTYGWEGVLPAANDPSQSQAAPDVHVALLPGSKEVKSSSVNGSEGWAVLSTAPHPDAAWQLLAYMASPAWQKPAALLYGDYPILSSLYSDPDLQQNVQDFPVYGEQFQYMTVRPQVPNYLEVSAIIQRYLHDALLQKVGAQPAMDAAAAEVNKLAGV